MSALKDRHMLNTIEQNMAEIAPYRKPALFSEFLVKGYTAITLSFVSEAKFSELLRAKVCLGTLITLYDDFADRPTQNNPHLLEILYQLNFGRRDSVRSLNPRDHHVVEFAKSLFTELEDILIRQPHYRTLREILDFDLKQFYSANQYSSLVMSNPHMKNILENRLYAHHNMGMIMVGMMDLMACERIDFLEFGAIREVLLLGQRMGRIFNVLTTHNREAIDGDITGELATCANKIEIEIAKQELRQEIQDLHNKMRGFNTRITTFSVDSYLEGLTAVQKLHEKMEGTI
ncbi:MAG: hypothetical protein AB1540_08185 [Bdellovibrionota bacterium]